MVLINNTKVYEEPTSCGCCPFMISGNSDLSYSQRGHCILFNEMHRCIRNIPRRCHKLFKKAMEYPEGTELIIVDRNE